MQNPDQPLHFYVKDEWRTWLQQNHTATKEVRLVILKKRAIMPGIFLQDALEEARCFSWVSNARAAQRRLKRIGALVEMAVKTKRLGAS